MFVLKRPMVVAHISDLHISIDHSRHIIRNVRRLLDQIMRVGVDHVVVTGDITADANPKEFDAARKLFKSYGLLDAQKMTVIPGNHDIYGGVHIAEEIFAFPKRCKMTDYDGKVNLFRESFHEVFEKTAIGGSSKLFPFVKLVGDIALVGVNSVAHYSRLKNPLGSNGEVGDGQFAKLQSLLTCNLFKNKRKLVLIHHHFNKIPSDSSGAIHNLWTSIEKQTMKLRGKKRLLELFGRTNVELVLHGHLHRNDNYDRDGIRFANTGGTVLGSSTLESHFRLIRVLDDSVESSLHAIPDQRSLPGLPLQRLPAESPRIESHLLQTFEHAAA